MLNTQRVSFPWNLTIEITFFKFHLFPFADDDSEFMSSQSDTATRNSIIVRLKGQVEITATPLLLEGLQRYKSFSFFHSFHSKIVPCLTLFSNNKFSE